MIKSFDTVADLTKVQIDVINKYLVESNFAKFTSEQIDFLSQIDDRDVLGLAHCCQYVRGYFFDRDTLLADGYINVNENFLNINEIMNQFIENTDKNEYSNEDYQELIKTTKAEKTTEIPQYGIILNTSRSSSTEILLLNTNLEPLNIEAYRV
ncbi:hypothetical protein A7M79_19315 [Acinetobacter baumannii]|uniref:hypothetical protein n=1 Tax=Acinetobacter baumannii TaxID=470 RepID=UPI0008DE96F3|nr:hypothetical protein [Acinetobacter baumannii]OIH01753.1 hypothetical protein A7M79_19315 [Acinetobacter baumannii]